MTQKLLKLFHSHINPEVTGCTTFTTDSFMWTCFGLGRNQEASEELSLKGCPFRFILITESLMFVLILFLLSFANCWTGRKKRWNVCSLFHTWLYLFGESVPYQGTVTVHTWVPPVKWSMVNLYWHKQDTNRSKFSSFTRPVNQAYAHRQFIVSREASKTQLNCRKLVIDRFPHFTFTFAR